MKIYVDELPKSCAECPCCSEIYFCNLTRREGVGYEGREKDCPLQSAADLEAENKQLKDIEQRKSFVLYSALCTVLEKSGDENVASMIDQMTKQDNGELCEMYKEYQNLKAENERLKTADNLWLDCYQKELDDLRKQLKEKEDELEKWKIYEKLYNEVFRQRINETTRADKAEEEVEEYQKEINIICNQFMVCTLKQLPKAITKQVSENILKKARGESNLNPDTFQEYISIGSLIKILDKIEKGDQNG